MGGQPPKVVGVCEIEVDEKIACEVVKLGHLLAWFPLSIWIEEFPTLQ
jgi:hypothetical protein